MLNDVYMFLTINKTAFFASIDITKEDTHMLFLFHHLKGLKDMDYFRLELV